MNTEETTAYYAENPAARWVALLVIGVSHFLVTLTLSATNVAVPQMGRELQVSAVLLSWIPTTYLLANVVTILPFGRMADNYGRRRIFSYGIVVFTLGCLLVGVATDMTALLAGRAVQGIGAAMMYSCGMAILLGVFPVNAQGMAIGSVMGATYFGLSCGPLVGGLLTEHIGWRSIFLSQLVLGCLLIVLIHRYLKGDWKNNLTEAFDYIGSLQMGVGCLILSFGLSLLPGWFGVSMMVAGCVILFIFVRRQLRCPNPLVRIRVVMNNQVFSTALVTASIMYASYYPIFFLMSLFLQYIQGMSPTEAGAMVFIQAIFMSIFAPFSGRMADRLSPSRIATLGCLILAVGFLLLLGINEQTTLFRIGVSVACIGVGFGCFSTPNNTRALQSVEPGRLGIASALMNLARNFGNIFGSAVVLGLISVIIGHAEIRPDQHHLLLRVIHIVFSLSLIYALYAAWLCYREGREELSR